MSAKIVIHRIDPPQDYNGSQTPIDGKIYAVYRERPDMNISVFECYLEDMSNDQLRINNLKIGGWLR